MILSIWNSITTPIEVAFRPDIFEQVDMITSNYVIDGVFLIDIFLNFITSYFNSATGDEVLEHRQIVKHYLQGSFWIDLLSILPFDLILMDIISDRTVLKTFSILKIFRILRLQKLITYMNTTDDMKHSLRLVKLCFLLVLYVHVIGCVYIYLNSLVPDPDHKWKPPQYQHMSYQEFSETIPWTAQWKFTFYASMLGLLGNDIYPGGSTVHEFAACLMLIIGAFINAHILGTIAMIV
jgi:hypothetical protein